MWQAAFMGLSALSSFSGDRAQAKAQKRIRAYRNKMANISNAINQNAITTNTTLTIQQSARQAALMRTEDIKVLGSNRVAAAAAGVKGNSVNATLIDAQKDRGMLEQMRREDLQTFFDQTTQQRLGSALSAVNNQDLSYIPKPRLSSYLLNAAASVDYSQFK